MQWVSLNAKHLKAASYDAERQELLIRTSNGSIRNHRGILPHMFENLVTSNDQQFYYRIYIAPSLVSDRQGAASIAGYLLKIGMLGAGALLLSAHGFLL
ncbi:KTSC domain-containing protein [Rhizobium puerariae]|uniref:KTSC domain-containing protein n=1 Tax=Rhizobium puerariae TaxID=1585791 RepID=A0ABV6ANH7_9HYPH